MSCATCHKSFASNHLRISCGKCSATHHKKCSGIAETDWYKFAKGEVLYNCDKCKKSRRSSVLGSANEQNISAVSPSNEMAAIKDDIASFKAAITVVQGNHEEVVKSLGFLHDTMTSIEGRLKLYDDKMKKVDEVVAENTRLRNTIASLEKRVVALEAGQTRPMKSVKDPKKKPDPVHKVTINGVKACDKEEKDIVNGVVSYLGLSPMDSVVGHERISSKDKATNIYVVTMKTKQHLADLIKAARTQKPTDEILGGDGTTKIFVNEKLSVSCYNLLKRAKDLKSSGYRFVWSKDGKVFAKLKEGDKTCLIRSVSDVEALENASH